ncbi:MAG: sulfotransferase [Candidatus Thermoplasmatota archaeon]|nr:sulfotransferase [Candidatus Thermoplasmatota archaeon]
MVTSIHMKKVAKKQRMPAQTGEFVKDHQLDDQFADQINNISYKPVFILGLHRSGTSILYKMLRSTKNFNSLTAYDVVYYNQLLYNKINDMQEEYKKRFNNLIMKTGQESRGIDRIKMNADFAIEYSFLLGPPYLFQQLKPDNTQIFDEMCRKLQFVKGKEKPLLLKNPWDFPNFLFIKKQVPDAKFIFIHRHPVDMMNSSMNALRVIVNKETVYSDIFSPFAKKIDENPLLQYFLKSLLYSIAPPAIPLVVENRALYTRRFLQDIQKLDPSSFVNVRYEDLCAKTTSTMQKIVNHLDIDGIDVESFEDFINPRDLTYTPDIKRMKSYILKRFAPYCSHFSYQ